MKFYFVKEGITEYFNYTNCIICVSKNGLITRTLECGDDIIHNPLNGKGIEETFYDEAEIENDEGDTVVDEVEVTIIVTPITKQHLRMFVFKQNYSMGGETIKYTISPRKRVLNFFGSLSEDERNELLNYHKERTDAWYKTISA